jgi:hypothetical protein
MKRRLAREDARVDPEGAQGEGEPQCAELRTTRLEARDDPHDLDRPPPPWRLSIHLQIAS